MTEVTAIFELFVLESSSIGLNGFVSFRVSIYGFGFLSDLMCMRWFSSCRFLFPVHHFCTVLLSFLLQQYLSCSEKLYQSRLQAVDFEHSTEETRQTINAWVESKTNGKDESHACLRTGFMLW